MTSPFSCRAREVTCHYGHVNRFYYLLTYPMVQLYLVPFLSYLTLNNIVNLKYGLEVTQDHSNWYHLKAWVRFPICLP